MVPARVSLIITVYNRERYLPATIESILSQTYSDFELLIWDDGSIDNSVAIAQHYAEQDSRIRVVAAPHQGRAPALKAAVAATTGTYLGFVDSDDLLAETAIQDTVAILDQKPHIGLVYTDYVVMDANGVVREYGPRCQTPYSKEQLLLEFMVFHFRLLHRSIYDQVGGIDVHFMCGQDYDLCLKISEITEIFHLPKPLYYYRAHKQSLTGEQRIQQILLSKKAVEDAFQRRGMANDYELDFYVFMRTSLVRKPAQDTSHAPEMRAADSAAQAHPQVSIILPTYNRKLLLDLALQSIFGQTYTDYEIVVIDDASTDGTVDWLQTTYPQLKVIALNHNQGAAVARNVGIRAAQGNIIAFLDSDDQWHGQYLEKQVQSLADHPKAMLSYTQSYSTIEGRAGVQPVERQPLDHHDLVISMLLGNFIDSLSQVVIPRWAWHKVGQFDERLQVCHDRELYLRLLALGTLTCVNIPLVTKFWQTHSLVTRNHCQTWLADGLLLLDIFYGRPENRSYLPLRSLAERLFRERVAQGQGFFANLSPQQHSLAAVRDNGAPVAIRTK
jgi:glycosyltransferase involved in cell wall biosynthesis